MLEIEQNRCSILEKKKLYYTIAEQMLKHMATTADDAAETNVCTEKYQAPAVSAIRVMRSSSELTSHCHL
jgi:hypothetical protein